MRVKVAKKPKGLRQGLMSECQHWCVLSEKYHLEPKRVFFYLYHGTSAAWREPGIGSWAAWQKMSRARFWEGKWSSSVGAASSSSCSELIPGPAAFWAPLMFLHPGWPTGNGKRWKKSQYIKTFSPWKHLQKGRQGEGVFICTARHSGFPCGLKLKKKKAC